MKQRPNILIALFTMTLIVAGCGSKSNEQTETESPIEKTAEAISKYPNHVGDIAFDEALDDPDFKTCQNYVPQYYALGADYRVDNDVLMAYFGTLDRSAKEETVYHTIRFIVNCKGRIGRLREETMTTAYAPAPLDSTFRAALKERLLAFDSWPAGRDFYQYLTFKIENGTIKEVLP